MAEEEWNTLLHNFLQIHQPQLESSGVPRIFWPTVFKKLSCKNFGSDGSFEVVKVNYDHTTRSPIDPVWKLFVSAQNGISVQDPDNIYIVKHIWIYDVSCAREDLIDTPDLVNRLCTIMGYDTKGKENAKIEYVLNEMWRYNQSFSLNSGSIEDRMPIWYIMDEIGSAINHNNDPNFRTVPFLYLPEGFTYSLLFPIQNVGFKEEVTRDFVEGLTNDPEKRKVLLLPWKYTAFDEESFIQNEPDENYFLAGHIRESLPIYEKVNCEIFKRDINVKLKVFSEYKYVNDYLHHPGFEVVDRAEDADILWYVSHFKEYERLSVESPHVFVNQFPFENVLTTKDLLSIVCRRKSGDIPCDPETLDTYPEWLPTTFNLCTELVEFVTYYQKRESRGLDNFWICKPWNLARGLDIQITDNLFHILRLLSTRPKIAQKYISNPVLYERLEIGKVKFDVRYVVMLKSVKPLKVYAYKNFFLRFANKAFALNNFDQYEQHFTVMNYSEDAPLCHVKCADFILEWERQYPDYPWGEHIESKILNMFREIFEAAIAEEPPKGIAESPQSRSVYAIDLMLQWKNEEIQPVLLEVNFTPDCQRACEYYPDFYNDIFQCLFLGDNNNEAFHDLCSTPN